MLKESRAQALIAFPGGKGTANCRSAALSMRLHVWAWNPGFRDFQMVYS